MVFLRNDKTFDLSLIYKIAYIHWENSNSAFIVIHFKCTLFQPAHHHYLLLHWSYFVCAGWFRPDYHPSLYASSFCVVEIVKTVCERQKGSLKANSTKLFRNNIGCSVNITVVNIYKHALNVEEP